MEGMRNEMNVVKVSVNKVMMFVASLVTSLRIWQNQQQTWPFHV